MAIVSDTTLAPAGHYGGGDVRSYVSRFNAWVSSNKERVLRFPVADGYAYYYIEDLDADPVTLIPVDFADDYRLPEWQLRGLTSVEARDFTIGQKERGWS